MIGPFTEDNKGCTRRYLRSHECGPSETFLGEEVVVPDTTSIYPRISDADKVPVLAKAIIELRDSTSSQ